MVCKWMGIEPVRRVLCSGTHVLCIKHFGNHAVGRELPKKLHKCLKVVKFIEFVEKPRIFKGDSWIFQNRCSKLFVYENGGMIDPKNSTFCTKKNAPKRAKNAKTDTHQERECLFFVDGGKRGRLLFSYSFVGIAFYRTTFSL